MMSGIDLPLARSCGSMILAGDLYGDLPAGDSVRFLCLQPTDGASLEPKMGTAGAGGMALLPLEKVTAWSEFRRYHENLRRHVDWHIADFRPDVIHIQHLTFGMASAFALAEPFIPKIALCHGTDVLFARSDPGHLDWTRRVIEVADQVVFPSKAMLRDTEALIARPVPHGTVLPWGISDECFTTSRAPRGQGQKKLLFAGRLVPFKGVGTLLEALARCPRVDLTLTVAGSGSDESALRGEALRLGVAGRVRFAGWLSRGEVRQMFDEHDALVVPSEEIEAFGLVAAEGLAAGIPVLHSSAGGLRELIAFPQLMFEAGDAADLARTIGRLVDGEVDLDLWAEHARGLRPALRISRMRAALLALTREVVRRGPRRPAPPLAPRLKAGGGGS